MTALPFVTTLFGIWLLIPIAIGIDYWNFSLVVMNIRAAEDESLIDVGSAIDVDIGFAKGIDTNFFG